MAGLAASVGDAYQQCRDRALRDTATRAAVYAPAIPLSRAERDLRREWYCSRSRERLRKPSKHREIGVKLNTSQPANTDRGQPVRVCARSQRVGPHSLNPSVLGSEAACVQGRRRLGRPSVESLH